jgi:unsaturated pyranuronate lyase
MSLWNDRPEAWHEILPGVRRRIVAHGAGAMMVLYRLDPERHFPRHAHPHAQFGTLLEGGGTFLVGDTRWELRPGSGYWVPPNVDHELTTYAGSRSVVLDVFVPERKDFLPEAVAPDIL